MYSIVPGGDISCGIYVISPPPNLVALPLSCHKHLCSNCHHLPAACPQSITLLLFFQLNPYLYLFCLICSESFMYYKTCGELDQFHSLAEELGCHFRSSQMFLIWTIQPEWVTTQSEPTWPMPCIHQWFSQSSVLIMFFIWTLPLWQLRDKALLFVSNVTVLIISSIVRKRFLFLFF